MPVFVYRDPWSDSVLTALDPLFPGMVIWLITCNVLGMDHQHDVAALTVCLAFVRAISLARFSSIVGPGVQALGCVASVAQPVLVVLWAAMLCLGVGMNVVSAIAQGPTERRALACEAGIDGDEVPNCDRGSSEDTGACVNLFVHLIFMPQLLLYFVFAPAFCRLTMWLPTALVVLLFSPSLLLAVSAYGSVLVLAMVGVQRGWAQVTRKADALWHLERARMTHRFQTAFGRRDAHPSSSSSSAATWLHVLVSSHTSAESPWRANLPAASSALEEPAKVESDRHGQGGEAAPTSAVPELLSVLLEANKDSLDVGSYCVLTKIPAR